MTNRWLRCEGQAGKFGRVEDVMDNSLAFCTQQVNHEA